MKTIPYKKALFILVGCLISFATLNSCSKVSREINAGKKLYTDFFVGEAGTQYYIKPLVFENSEDSKQELLMDLTFRYKDRIKDSVIINFSIIGETPIKRIEKLTLASQELSVTSDDVNFLFNERGNKGYISRFTTKIPLIELKRMVDLGYNWKLEVQSPNLKLTHFAASKRTIKSLNRLNQSLFIVLN